MLKDLIRRLTADADDAPLPKDDQRIALAALLVIAAHADHDYADAEQAQIERVLAERFGLDAGAARRLREEGEAAEAAATDFVRFTTLIKKHVPIEERSGVLEALWRVVLSDGTREMHEDALMRRLVDLLGLEERDSANARRRALSLP